MSTRTTQRQTATNRYCGQLLRQIRHGNRFIIYVMFNYICNLLYIFSSVHFCLLINCVFSVSCYLLYISSFVHIRSTVLSCLFPWSPPFTRGQLCSYITIDPSKFTTVHLMSVHLNDLECLAQFANIYWACVIPSSPLFTFVQFTCVQLCCVFHHCSSVFICIQLYDPVSVSPCR